MFDRWSFKVHTSKNNNIQFFAISSFSNSHYQPNAFFKAFAWIYFALKDAPDNIRLKRLNKITFIDESNFPYCCVAFENRFCHPTLLSKLCFLTSPSLYSKPHSFCLFWWYRPLPLKKGGKEWGRGVELSIFLFCEIFKNIFFIEHLQWYIWNVRPEERDFRWDPRPGTHDQYQSRDLWPENQDLKYEIHLKKICYLITRLYRTETSNQKLNDIGSRTLIVIIIIYKITQHFKTV